VCVCEIFSSPSPSLPTHLYLLLPLPSSLSTSLRLLFTLFLPSISNYLLLTCTYLLFFLFNHLFSTSFNFLPPLPILVFYTKFLLGFELQMFRPLNTSCSLNPKTTRAMITFYFKSLHYLTLLCYRNFYFFILKKLIPFPQVSNHRPSVLYSCVFPLDHNSSKCFKTLVSLVTHPLHLRSQMSNREHSSLIPYSYLA
jgi:hypothetical protein